LKLERRKIKPQLLYGAPERTSTDKFIDFIISRMNPSRLETVCLVSVVADMFSIARDVEFDFSFGDAFNIIPTVVKRPEDVAMAPGINPDGSGLAATLMYLSRTAVEGKQVPNRHYMSSRIRARSNSRIRSTASLQEIERLTSVANRSISGLRVETDSFDGRIRVYCKIAGTNGDVEIPIQNVSDGTAKWMALVSALVANTKLFAIEEPENFLHPSMQREIVEILRSSLDRQPNKSFALLSTHSETLLNASRPEELVIVQMEGGKTVATRVQDVETVRKLIDETGFGLGWYYVTDAFL
jgi:predicted ATPase